MIHPCQSRHTHSSPAMNQQHHFNAMEMLLQILFHFNLYNYGVNCKKKLIDFGKPQVNVLFFFSNVYIRVKERSKVQVPIGSISKPIEKGEIQSNKRKAYFFSFVY